MWNGSEMAGIGTSILFELCVLPRVISLKKREADGRQIHQQRAAEANFMWSPA